MKKPFFIMMYSSDGEHMQPLVGNEENDFEDDYATGYEFYHDAEIAALKHPYASVLGFKIFDMDEV